MGRLAASIAVLLRAPGTSRHTGVIEAVGAQVTPQIPCLMSAACTAPCGLGTHHLNNTCELPGTSLTSKAYAAAVEVRVPQRCRTVAEMQVMHL